MKLISKSVLALAMSLSLVNASEYLLDNSHTEVGFSVKHLMITNVKGEFKSYDAEIDFDAKNMIFNKFNATVDTESIDTGIEKEITT